MIIKLIVDGGAMKPGPAVAQQLGPMGVNLGKVIDDVNKATTGFKGMKVPVEVDVDPMTKTFTIHVASPPVAELIKKEIGLDKGSGKPGDTKIGNISIEQAISIAKTKMPGMLARDLRAALQLVVGSCVSLGVLVESKPATEVAKDIKNGVYDKEIKAEKTETSEEKKAQLKQYFNDLKNQQDVRAKAAEAEKAKLDAEKAEKAAATPAPAAAKKDDKAGAKKK